MAKKTPISAKERADQTISMLDGHIGWKLKLKREGGFMSSEEIAAELGVTADDLKLFENGTKSLTARQLYELAVIFSVETSYFYDGFTSPMVIVQWYWEEVRKADLKVTWTRFSDEEAIQMSVDRKAREEAE